MGGKRGPSKPLLSDMQDIVIHRRKYCTIWERDMESEARSEDRSGTYITSHTVNHPCDIIVIVTRDIKRLLFLVCPGRFDIS